MTHLADRIALITGASRGLGRAIALTLAEAGARVQVGYRSRQADAADTLQAVAEAGGRGSLLPIDVTDRSSVEAAVKQVRTECGGLDILVNNAGVAHDGPFGLMSPAAWDRVLEVNLTGTFNCCRAVAHLMIGRRRGAIVNIASVAGMHASEAQTNYAASKGGVLAFTRTLARELAPHGVRVNAVVPGLLTTGMAARVDRRILERKRARIALGRAGEAEEVARVVRFLVSDEASYIVGQAVVVDGGLTL